MNVHSLHEIFKIGRIMEYIIKSNADRITRSLYPRDTLRGDLRL